MGYSELQASHHIPSLLPHGFNYTTGMLWGRTSETALKLLSPVLPASSSFPCTQASGRTPPVVISHGCPPSNTELPARLQGAMESHNFRCPRIWNRKWSWVVDNNNNNIAWLLAKCFVQGWSLGSLQQMLGCGAGQSWACYCCSVAQLCLTFCHLINCSMQGFPVLHYLPGFTQTHVHWVSDVIQPSHPLSTPSPPAVNLAQHQGLFQWVDSSYQAPKVLEFQLQHQSFQWIFRVDFL